MVSRTVGGSPVRRAPGSVSVPCAVSSRTSSVTKNGLPSVSACSLRASPSADGVPATEST